MSRVQNSKGWGGAIYACLSGCLVILWLTGCLLFLWPTAELMELSEWQVACSRSAVVVHGVLAWGLCLLLGRGVWPHVQLMFRSRVNRHQWGWGMVNLGVLLALLLSAMALQYGPLTWHEWMSRGHVWLGVLVPVPYVIHGWSRLISRRASTLGA